MIKKTVSALLAAAVLAGLLASASCAPAHADPGLYGPQRSAPAPAERRGLSDYDWRYGNPRAESDLVEDLALLRWLRQQQEAELGDPDAGVAPEPTDPLTRALILQRLSR